MTKITSAQRKALERAGERLERSSAQSDETTVAAQVAQCRGVLRQIIEALLSTQTTG